MIQFSRRIAVRLGEHTISTNKDCDFADDHGFCDSDPIQDIEIEKVICHENYSNRKRMHDIAILKLVRSAHFKGVHNVETICLPITFEQDIEHELSVNGKHHKMIVAGWGMMENREYSDVLLKGEIPYVNRSTCSEFYNDDDDDHNLIQETHLVKKEEKKS